MMADKEDLLTFSHSRQLSGKKRRQLQKTKKQEDIKKLKVKYEECFKELKSTKESYEK